VISAEVGRAKPDQEIYRLALKQVQVLPDEAVFVDDFPVNIEGCEKAGMRGILFRDPDIVVQEIRTLL
jgi:putative hydrolase of the HAD superfamily